MEQFVRKQDWDDDVKADEMNKVKNWDFKAQKMPDVKHKSSGWRKFLSFLAWGFGKLFGSGTFASGTLGNDVSTAKANRAKMQEKRQHDQIPGWDGAKYDPSATEGEDILADFRRVPTVWSYLIADEAVDSKGKPLDPIVTVYVDQPEKGTSQTMVSKNMGHAMIGIEYSRFRKRSNRYERYALKYGFYPAGGIMEGAGGMSLQSRSAVLPG